MNTELSLASCVSAGGRVSIDKKKNQLVYGSRVKPADVLDGRFDAPEEFESLYTVLNAVASQR